MRPAIRLGPPPPIPCAHVLNRLINLWNVVRSSYWFVPGIVLAAMALVAEGLVRLDRALATSGKALPEWVPQLRPGVAEQMLLTIANASVAMASLVFSITLVVLTLTAGNYGPRLLRRFMSDTPTQIVLGLYTGTLLYCLLVLRSTAAVGDERFVPHLAVSGAMVVALADVLMLTFFVHHMSHSIHATSMLWSISADLDKSIDDLFPDDLGEDLRGEPHKPLPVLEGLPSHAVRPSRPGYLRAVDASGLMCLAKDNDLILSIPPIGAFVGPLPVAVVRTAKPLRDELLAEIRSQFIVGPSRTPSQDVQYSINRLVELGARALSPGVNDPFTAIACLDQAEVALSKLVRKTFPSAERFDDEGRLRVVASPLSMATVLSDVYDPIRQYGSGQMLVSRRMLQTLRTVMLNARVGARKAEVRSVTDRVWETVRLAQQNDPGLAELERLYCAVLDATSEQAMLETAATN